MICTISGSAAVFKDNFDHSFDVILGYLSRGDVVVVIQTFNHDYSAIVVGVPFGSRIHVLTSYGIFWAHGGHFTDDEKTT